MFLRKLGKSGRFTFDIIYSSLQKSLRRGDEELAIEMGYEFIDYPNALKKRLIQNCTEDCPNLNLIWDIYNTKPEMELLMAWIPVICKHTKCRDGIYGMRVACEMDFLFDSPKVGDDDLLTLLRKCYTYVCKGREDEFIKCFQPFYSNFKLKNMYNFINKHITFLYTLCVWSCVDYMHENYYVGLFKMDAEKKWDINLQLPFYVYDKHVGSSPPQNKSYSFFIDNCVIYPRHGGESILEQRGKRLYKESNKGVSSMIRPVVECDTLNEENTLLIQVQLITAKYKPRVYFCSINNGKMFDYVLKGPFKRKEDMEPQLLSDNIKCELLTYAPYDSRIVSYKKDIYLLSINLIPVTKNKVEIKSSKLESDAPIYSGEKFMFDHEKLDKLTTGEKENLLEILAFRKLIGTNDTCSRNIIYYDKLFYSIDDPVLLTQTDFIFKKPLCDQLKEKYEQILRENFSYVKTMLKKWDKVIYYSENIPNNVKIFMRLRIVDLLHKNNWVF